MDKYKHTSPEELRAYVLDMADTLYVEWAYSRLHGQWHPSTNGGQDGNWDSHRAFYLKLAEIRGQWEEPETDAEG